MRPRTHSSLSLAAALLAVTSTLAARSTVLRAAVPTTGPTTQPAAGAAPLDAATPVVTQSGEGPGPRVEGSVVHVLTGTAEREVNFLALPAAAPQPVEWVEVALSLKMDAASEGVGLLLLDADVVGHDAGIQALDQWEEPSRRDAIGIGLDAKNVPSLDPYDENGNYKDRPQREASVHVDGVEILNRQSADFATGKVVPVFVRLMFVPGGAKLTLRVADQAVYEEELLPGVRPFTPRVAIGARTGPKSVLDVVNLTVTPGPAVAAEAFPPAKRLVLFENTLVSLATTREPQAIIDFSELPPRVGRVIATLTLDPPPAGNMDKRDCRGAFYLYAADRQRFELMRFRTGFAKPWQWKVDMTDFLPLLRDQQRFGLAIDTWRDGGFLASLTLDVYPGQPDRTPISVVNLWQGEPILGDPKLPAGSFFDTKTVIAPPGAREAKARLVVTGHGKYPNSRNAAEGLALGRSFTANGQTFSNLLWKTDNYLNPCRPQRGPWKTDRAGWGPGSIVEPWTIELTPVLAKSRELTLDYRVTDDYTNEHVGKGDPPTHWVDGQVIFYGNPTPATTRAMTTPAK